MCQMCAVAASGIDPGSHVAPSSVEPGLRRAAPVNLEAAHGAAASPMPEGVGVRGRRVLIKGGTVLSMDESVGNHAAGDVLVDGSKIVEVAASIHAPDAAVIDASGHIVMPGFIDTNHHQFETALRSFLADAILISDGARLATIGGAKGLKIDSKPGRSPPAKTPTSSFSTRRL